MAEIVEAAGGEEIDSHHFANVAPVGPVRRQPEARVLVSQEFRDRHARPRRKDAVVGGEAFLHHLPTAHHHTAVGAEPEGEDGAVLVGHGPEGTSHWGPAAEEAEVPYKGPCTRWLRWHGFLPSS